MGAENRHHPPRPCPRETLLPCRHAASPRPSVGGRPLQGHVQPVWPKAKVRRAERGGRDPLLWPRALRSKATPAGRAGLRAGEEIPEPGNADVLLPGEGEGAPFRLEVGCQCNSKGGRPCVVPRGPRGRASPSPRPPPPRPSSQVPSHLQARPGQRRGRQPMECMIGTFLGLAVGPRLRPSRAAWARVRSPAPAPVGFWV